MIFLQESIKHTWTSIRKHPYLFLLIILLHILLIGILIHLLLNYPAQILGDVQGIMQPLEEANYNATSIQEGALFTPELGNVFQSYSSLKSHVYRLMTWIGGIFVFILAAIWILTTRIVNEVKEKEIKHLILAWGKYLGIGIIFSVVPFLISYLILTTFFDIESTSTAGGLLWLVMGIILIFYYFGLVGFALIYQKRIWTNWIKVAFRRIHFSLAILLLNLFIFLVLGAGIYLLMEVTGWFVLGIILAILLFIAVILARIFWASYVYLQSQEHENKP